MELSGLLADGWTGGRARSPRRAASPSTSGAALRYAWTKPLIVYFKREDLNHTGSHKINNALGQVLLTRRMGKTRVIAETGAGQHGVLHRHGRPLGTWLDRRLHGGGGHESSGPQRGPDAAPRRRGDPVDSGTKTLKDATNEAIRDWVTSVRYGTHYIIGIRRRGPAPYPMMVREFQVGDQPRTGAAR